jgi:protein-S-isoprenylcysteine O-methyltransferase Ste14
VPEIPSLGARGGGWVAIQFVLMGVIVAAAVLGSPWPDAVALPLAVIGTALVVGGVLLGLASGRALGAGLTPFPRPSRSGSLVERGPYRRVRHPIYSAGILVFCGLSLILSPAALLASVALVVTWALKSAVEERFLCDHYPAYVEYERRVRWRLVPYVY